MPKFTVEHETKLSPADAFAKVCDYLQHSEGIKKLDSDLKFDLDPKNHSGKVKGSKFDCHIKVTGQNPTRVALEIDISFLLSPFKGKIQETLKEKMHKVLG